MPAKRVLRVEKEELWPEKFAREVPAYQFLMRALISCALLAVAIYILLTQPLANDAAQKWAYGIVGTILGYWFTDNLFVRRR